MKQKLLHGIMAGTLAGIAGHVYNTVYSEALLVDFSVIINLGSIFGSTLFACVLASVGYHLLGKWLPKGVDPIFNIIFLAITFLSFVGTFSAELPLDIEDPELFIGLSIPMHLLPVLFWLATKPLFKNNV